MASSDLHGPARDWLSPRLRSDGLARYLAILAQRWLLVACITLLTVVAAVAYVKLSPSTYTAEADLLVTPVPAGGDATSGLGLITASNDPTQATTTAARLVTTSAIGSRALRELRRGGTAQELFGKVTVEPIAASNLVSVVAHDDTAVGAARLASAVATAAVDVRTDQLHAQIRRLLPALERRQAALPADARNGQGTLGETITSLGTLAVNDDPTLRVSSFASVPSSPSSPGPKLAVAAGLVAGLLLGVGAAFAIQTLDPKLRREEQLRDLFRLPILGRIPHTGRRRTDDPLEPAALSRAATEAYRTLRATIDASIEGKTPTSLLITSSGSREGKTTTALNVAHSLMQSGNRVILIEADVRRPTLARTLGRTPKSGIGGVLTRNRTVARSLTTVPAFGNGLRFLMAERAIPASADRLTAATSRRLIDEAAALADYVVIDAPPLSEVIDALPLAQQVDAVLVIARLGRSRLRRLTDLGEILMAGGVEPIGIAAIGGDVVVESDYYIDDVPEPAVVN